VREASSIITSAYPPQRHGAGNGPGARSHKIAALTGLTLSVLSAEESTPTRAQFAVGNVRHGIDAAYDLGARARWKSLEPGNCPPPLRVRRNYIIHRIFDARRTCPALGSESVVSRGQLSGSLLANFRFLNHLSLLY